jgi:hypothetical protein
MIFLRHRVIAAVVGSVVGLTVLAACGDDPDTNAAKDQPAVAQPTAGENSAGADTGGTDSGDPMCGKLSPAVVGKAAGLELGAPTADKGGTGITGFDGAQKFTVCEYPAADFLKVGVDIRYGVNLGEADGWHLAKEAKSRYPSKITDLSGLGDEAFAFEGLQMVVMVRKGDTVIGVVIHADDDKKVAQEHGIAVAKEALKVV